MQHVAISWWWRRETATGAGVVGAVWAVEARELPANSQSASLMECCKADAMNDDSQLLLTSPAALAPSCSSSSIVRHFGQEFQYSLATSHSDDFSDFTVFFLSVLLLLAASVSVSVYLREPFKLLRRHQIRFRCWELLPRVDSWQTHKSRGYFKTNPGRPQWLGLIFGIPPQVWPGTGQAF